MSFTPDGTSLHFAGLYGDTRIYGLDTPRLRNRYSLLSGPLSRRLLAFPETVGFPCYTALLDGTVAGLRHLFPEGSGADIDIFTILRGGLNYPLEEACFRNGIRVRDMHFVSCERVIRDHVILGLDIRYEKIRPTPGRTVAIGDILATGDTLRRCLRHFADVFLAAGCPIRRLILFTIGGTRAIPLLEAFSEKMGRLSPDFEGVDCFFFEGMFSVYEDKGASGINVPDIDFGWKGGVVSPDFRRFVLDHPDALLERCIIYDGGARRYEIPVHFHEVLEYWEGILGRAEVIDPAALLREKLGYDGPLPYEEWLEAVHYQDLAAKGPEGLWGEGLRDVWAREQALFDSLPDLGDVARRRIREIQTIQKQYETN